MNLQDHMMYVADLTPPSDPEDTVKMVSACDAFHCNFQVASVPAASLPQWPQCQLASVASLASVPAGRNTCLVFQPSLDKTTSVEELSKDPLSLTSNPDKY